MFIESTIPSGRRRLPAGIATAVVAHTIAIALLILIPLLQSSQLPPLPPHPALSVMLEPPPPPPPPPAPRSAAQAQPRTPRPEPAPPEQVRFVAPTKIPEEIPEEPEFEIGMEGGSDLGIPGGVPYGTVDGVPGGLPTEQPVAQPIRVGGTIPKPRLMKRVEPKYPAIAAVARVQGIVIVEATTDATGHVIDVRVLKSIKLLDSAACDAVRQWIYEPVVLDGRPQPVIFTVTVEFVLK